MNLNYFLSHSFFSAEVLSPEPVASPRHPVELLVVEPQGLELSLVQPELLEGSLVHRITNARVTTVNLLQTLVEKILKTFHFCSIFLLTVGDSTRIADIAATMAGVPKPWLIIEKCVKCLWMPGSSRGWGRVLHRGLRSWFRKSTSSLQINLRGHKQHEA